MSLWPCLRKKASWKALVKKLKGSSSVSVVEDVVGYFLWRRTHARTKIKKISPQASRPNPRREDVCIDSLLLVMLIAGRSAPKRKKRRWRDAGRGRAEKPRQGECRVPCSWSSCTQYTSRPLDLNSQVRRPNPLGSGVGATSHWQTNLWRLGEDRRSFSSSIRLDCCCKPCFESLLSLCFALLPRTSCSDFLEIGSRGSARAGAGLGGSWLLPRFSGRVWACPRLSACCILESMKNEREREGIKITHRRKHTEQSTNPVEYGWGRVITTHPRH